MLHLYNKACKFIQKTKEKLLDEKLINIYILQYKIQIRMKLRKRK